jgi:hypothetical protein
MRRLTITGLCLTAVLAASAFAAAGASAALPEFGRCVKAAPHTGTYKYASCVVLAPGGKGSYNWEPGPAALKKFEGTGELTTLETVGKVKVECAGSTFNGEYTGAKTETVTITLINCVDSTKRFCQSNPAKEGEIETPLALEGELGFIAGGERPMVGLDLKHSPDIVTFECGKLPETVLDGVVEGSVISRIRPIEKMTAEFKQTYTESRGKQIPQQFEGGAKDTLSTTLISGLTKTTEESGLKNKLVTEENEEPLEIKAK